MSDYYDRHGNPLTLMEWAVMFEDWDAKNVAQSDVGVSGDTVHVSTVWLGLNHQWTPSGRPLIFETLVQGGSLDQEMDRYTTERAALAGHKAMCERVQAS